MYNLLMNSHDDLLKKFETDLNAITTLEEYQRLETNYLGRNGSINQELKKIKDLSVEARREFGEAVNKIKQDIEQQLSLKKQALLTTETLLIDVTLPGTPYPKGSLHMVTLAIEEISRIFEHIGFIRMSYPEIEWEHFSFETLNMPKDHPARDDFETFFVNAPPHKTYGKMVLSPHTSSGQNREMLRVGKPPIRMINIAKCYRPNWDATHVPMFHQFEGVCIDESVTITHLKGTIDYFAKEFFGEKRETRLRPFHFQFTEPSFEVDITCDVCDGTGYVSSVIPSASEESSQRRNALLDPSLIVQDDKVKCKVCKSGWLELGGAGMIHPNVLTAGNIDPEKYTGWAFGIGVERVMMMKGGINLDDLRIMYSGDVRFLEQF